MCQENGCSRGDLHLSREEVTRLAMEINSPELWAFIHMYNHGRCTWGEAMQGATIHLARRTVEMTADAVRRESCRQPQSVIIPGTHMPLTLGGSHG